MADKTPSDESLRLELQEAIATFRHQIVQLVQALGFSITANSVLLVYGFSQRLAAVLLAASLVPIATLFIYIQIMTGLLPICYVAIRLELKLSLRQDPFIGTWARMRKDLPFSSLANLTDLEDPNIRDSMLNVSPRQPVTASDTRQRPATLGIDQPNRQSATPEKWKVVRRDRDAEYLAYASRARSRPEQCLAHGRGDGSGAALGAQPAVIG